MFDFIFGYVLGSSARNETPLSGKTIAIIVLVGMVLVGAGYMMMPLLFPDSVSAGVEQCGGGPMAAMMCELEGKASTIGLAFICLVIVLAGVWGLFSSLGSCEK